MPDAGGYGYSRYLSKREKKTRKAQEIKKYLRQGWPLERARRQAQKDWQ
jgi:hypothetical protein